MTERAAERVAVVTGAARGIGAEVARRLARDGWPLVLVDACAPQPPVDYPMPTPADLITVARDCTDAGSPEALPVIADVGDGVVRDALHDALRRRVPAVTVAAAGVIQGHPAWAVPDDAFELLLRINLFGVRHLADVCVPAMVEAGNGRFVAVASAAALRAMPRLAAYSAAKAAVVGYVRGLAADLAGTGVTANAVCPGSTRGAMLAASAAVYDLPDQESFAAQALLRRLLSPGEVAAAVALAVRPRRERDHRRCHPGRRRPHRLKGCPEVAVCSRFFASNVTSGRGFHDRGKFSAICADKLPRSRTNRAPPGPRVPHRDGSGAGTGLFETAGDEHAGEVLTVGGARAQVSGRPGPLRRVGGGVAHRGAVGKRLLDRGCPHRCVRHVHKRDRVALHRHTDDRPVDGAFGELLERPAGRGGFGHPDLGQQFTSLQRRIEQAEEELVGTDLALAVRPARNQRRVQREDDRGQVGCRVAVRQGAADGAAVPDLRVTDLTGGVGEQRQFAGEHTGGLEIVVAGEGADGDVVTLVADIGQISQPADVHDHLWDRQAQLHQREQGVPSGEEFRVLAELAGQFEGLVYRPGPRVGESCGNQEAASRSTPRRLAKWPPTTAPNSVPRQPRQARP